MADRPLIDTNVYLFRWPFRRVTVDEPAALVRLLEEQGVVQAWAGSLEGVFDRDVSGVNQRLAAVCAAYPHLLAPMGSLNLALPDWQDDLRRCHELYGMRGVRLHPNYHGYTLDAPAVRALWEAAAHLSLVVQVVALLEDERTQAPACAVPHVALAPLLDHMRAVPQARVQVLNAQRALRPGEAEELAAAGVAFDLATVEGAGGVGSLVERIGPQRLLFGSFQPLYYFESARLKLRESSLGAWAEEQICVENARRLLAAA